MENGHAKSHALTTKCPACGRDITACSLPALIQQVSACCRGKRTRRGRFPVAPKVPVPPADVRLPVELRFGRLVISQNQTTYSHWSRHHRDKKDWLSRVQLAGRQLIGARFRWSRWKLLRVYMPPHRELDHANLVGGAKPLIDSLVTCGIIEDDRRANFLCDYVQEVGDRNETILTLLEVSDHDRAS